MNLPASSLRFPTIAFALAVLLIPASMWLERAQSALWTSGLFLPHVVPLIHKHTPAFPVGRFLPPAITHDLTLTAQDNPVLIAHSVTVPAGITLTLQPGVHVYAGEFGQLTVAGSLQAQGTAEDPITFASNELNPLNQTWNGLVFAAGSNAVMNNIRISQASPGITCGAGSRAAIDAIDISGGSMGIFAASPDCVITNSHLLYVRTF
jgi:hypothetical protein